MKAKRTTTAFRILTVSAALAVAAAFAPATARANITALHSADQINAPAFTFDTVDIGFVHHAGWQATNNSVTSDFGFMFAEGTNRDVYIESLSGDASVKVLGAAFGFDGAVKFIFEDGVQAAGIEYDTFTSLSLLAFDSNGNLINTEGSITADPYTSGFLGIASSNADIHAILIHDSAGTFSVDNLRFGTLAAVAPVPGALSLGALGLGLVFWTKRKS